MKMSKPGLCCDDCFALLAKRSVKGAKLWLDLCEIQSTCAVFGLIMVDHPLLKLLEHSKLITTTDQMEVIVIKVHGMKQDAMGPFFCGGLCERK